MKLFLKVYLVFLTVMYTVRHQSKDKGNGDIRRVFFGLDQDIVHIGQG